MIVSLSNKQKKKQEEEQERELKDPSGDEDIDKNNSEKNHKFIENQRTLQKVLSFK